MNTALTLASLHLHPVKSCGGVAVSEALVIETGLEFDRAWMVVDRDGRFVSQRVLPRMALVQPTLRAGDMVLRAPGMLALHVQLDAVEGRCTVRVHDDEVEAFDMGDLAAQWFSDFLGRPLRLARFDPDVQRRCDPRWSGGVEATTAFADKFPLLVASTASLDGLNGRLRAVGHEPVTLQRFRPNLVLDGLDDAHGEDFIDRLVIDSPDGDVVLALVKRCTRCSIPDVDPRTGEPAHAVGEALRGYRADPSQDGRLTFGQNAVVVSGVEHRLRVGAAVRATIAFD